MRTRRVVHTAVLISVVACCVQPLGSIAQQAESRDYSIRLKSRVFTPVRGVESALAAEAARPPWGRRHVILQLEDIPTIEERAALERSGVRLVAYLPEYAWFASIPQPMNWSGLGGIPLRWVGPVLPEDRKSAALSEQVLTAESLDGEGRAQYDLRVFSDVSKEETLAMLARYGVIIESDMSTFHRYLVRMEPGLMETLAGEDVVQWIGPGLPPKSVANDGIRARTNVNAVQTAPYNLTGANVDLGIWDGGRVYNHTDFSGRLTLGDPTAGVHEHSTHVAGTMAGSGAASATNGGTANQWRGVATGADIISYDWNDNINEVGDAIATYGIDLSQNSWGYTVNNSNCSLYGNYDGDAPAYDDIVTGRFSSRRLPVVFAAGNERNDCDCGMSCTLPLLNYANIPPPGTAKNVITVGSTNSQNETITEFSSWGPVDDGRIKPEVMAPGCEEPRDDAHFNSTIWSTQPNNVYGGMCGTSMSAPAVSGIIALMIQQYRTSSGITNPLPSTMKALLVQTALDLNDATSYFNPGPDYASGYGRVNAQAAIDEIRSGHYREDQVSNGSTDTFYVTVASGAASLKVTLAWDDEPGTVNANPALVNNLDLLLVAPGGTQYRPWVLDPAHPANNATTGIDNRNNLEQVLVSSPAAGTWEVRVIGTTVPVGPQRYSLAGQDFSTVSGANVGPVDFDLRTIDDDNFGNSHGNNNHVVNPGEDIELLIRLRNTGTETASSVTATLSTADPNVTFLFNTSSGYGNIAAGGTATCTNDYDLRVKATTPHGHAIRFTLNISATLGGPWTDDFYLVVVGTGKAPDVALISDKTELESILTLLNRIGVSYHSFTGNWDGKIPVFTPEEGFLKFYDTILWYGSGGGLGRLTTQQEHDALENFLQGGGKLLVTGYDTLGSPTDALLANLVRSSSSGDGPFTLDYAIKAVHPITRGPFGTFPVAIALRAARSDHDTAEADTARGAVTVAELTGGRDKIIATQLPSGGKIVYWNGNDRVSDWLGIVPSGLQEQMPAEEKEVARLPEPEALQGDIQSVIFPATGDTLGVANYPHWWVDGDFVQGSRTLSLPTVNLVRFNWATTRNALTGTGRVDLALMLNGIVVGRPVIYPDETSKVFTYIFTPIAGPTYTIRLEETNTVDAGKGSLWIPLNISSLTFYAPSTAEQTNLLANTIYWFLDRTRLLLPAIRK